MLNSYRLVVCAEKQTLLLYRNGFRYRRYQISTAVNGLGEQKNSGCTPRGWHEIRVKIGGGEPTYTVFKGRRPTGEVFTRALAEKFPDRDWILSRILWLRGLEAGKNLYGLVDTTWRYIYFHGAPDHLIEGEPASHGCVRMNNRDIVELYQLIPARTPVLIY